ncbi:hypothetical protein Rs2_03369 [Raphanus sativus]|nr:hypothetical protein Rs2_03369 [Raphanus sativus]
MILNRSLRLIPLLLSRPLKSSPFRLPLRLRPFSSASSPMKKNGSSKSSPFEFNKRRADGFDETGKAKKNLERKTRKLNPNTTAYAQLGPWNGNGYARYILLCSTLL